MKRTIQIGDKYKQLIDEYETQYDKEEFNMLITKLLVLNKDLQNNNIDLFVIGSLIKQYNIDFFTLIQGLSIFKDNIGITKNLNNDIEDTPLINISTKKEKKKEIKETKEIEENNNVLLEQSIQKEEAIQEKVIDNTIATPMFSNTLFQRKKEDEINTGKNVIDESKVINPILDLDIDLTN